MVFEADNELEEQVVEPRDGEAGFVEAGSQQDGVVGAAAEAHFDAVAVDADGGSRADEVLEDVAGAASLVALAEGAGLAVGAVRVEAPRQQPPGDS